MPGIIGPLTRQCVNIAKFQLLELDRAGQIYFFAPNFSGTELYLGARSGTRKNGPAKPKCTANQETTRNFLSSFT